MRPLLLKFAGIGSYPGHVEIDFNDLSAMGLYLIVGRTGAGKTTIFDAMTYALYGKVATDRENAIISGHPGSKKPFIEFTFEHAGLTYVAHREPTPPGKQSVANNQWLSIRNAGGDETQRITQTRPVTNKIKEVIGLNDAEFMQVILLPQGKFQQFLLARSNDKKGMLQAIFGTGAYRRIVDRMIVSANQMQTELDQDSQEISNQWAIIGNSHQSLQEIENFGELPDYVEQTAALIEVVRQKATIAETEAKAANENFANAKTALAQAELEAERFDKAQTRKALEVEHSKQATSVEKARTAVSKHTSATPIAEAAAGRNILETDIKELSNNSQDCRSAVSRLAASIKVKADAIKKFVDAIPTATPNVLASEFAKAESFVIKASEKFNELSEVTNDIETLEVSDQGLGISFDEKSTELKTATKQIVDLKKDINESRNASRDLGLVERKIENLDELLDEADDREAKAEIERATKLRDKHQKKFDELSANLRAEQDRRTKYLAGELAANLKNDDECPVCGSTDHPKKAKRVSGTIDMESLSDKRDSQLELVKDAEQDLKAAQKSLKQAQAAKAKLPPVAEQKELRKQFAALTKLSQAEEPLAKSLTKIEAKEKALTRELEDIKIKRAEIKTSLTTLKRRFATLTKETEAFGVSAHIESALEVLEEISDSIDELTDVVTELNSKQGQLKQANTNISKLLTKTEFSNEKSVLAALLDDETFDNLEELIADALSRTEEIGKLTAAIGDKPLPKKRPDIEALLEQVNLATDINNSAQGLFGTVSGALKDITKAYKTIQKIGPTFTEKQRKVNTAQTIADIFKRGTSNSSGGRLDLETWVLRTLFEEVCLVANSQMRKLSSNRYTLTLEQEEGGVTKQYGGGLDIYVLDAQTGLTRPVQTMSGGEQFIASLSLALALAEVVQRHAGGIEVPCLFIDEGFGGLDLETLDLAIDALLEIQATGRSVGVITHVETMQQLLPIGIQIHKGHSGSTLEVLAS